MAITSHFSTYESFTNGTQSRDPLRLKTYNRVDPPSLPTRPKDSDKETTSVLNNKNKIIEDQKAALNNTALQQQSLIGNNTQQRSSLNYNQNTVTEGNNSAKGTGSSSVPAGLQAVIDASKTGKFYSHSRGWTTLGNSKYKKLCTSGPETFYRAIGIELKGLWWNTGHPGTATDTKITQKGFTKVWSGSSDDAKNKAYTSMLQPGDIMLQYGHHKGGGASAHACMWNGEQWVSDTYQGDKSWVEGNGRCGSESAQIYRLSNVASNSGNSISSGKKSTGNSDNEIIVDKTKKTLTYKGKTYAINISKYGIEAKNRDGDGLTPEGTFKGKIISHKNGYQDKEYGWRPNAYGTLGKVLKLSGVADNGFDISNSEILVHGSDKINAPGGKGSHGCIAMLDADQRSLMADIGNNEVTVRIKRGGDTTMAKRGTKIDYIKNYLTYKNGGIIKALSGTELPDPTKYFSIYEKNDTENKYNTSQLVGYINRKSPQRIIYSSSSNSSTPTLNSTDTSKVFDLKNGQTVKSGNLTAQINNGINNLLQANLNGYQGLTGNGLTQQNNQQNGMLNNNVLLKGDAASDGISEAMFQKLLGKEGAHKNSDGTLTAHAEGKSFGESFVTGPYGMVYKHIDANGNLLSKIEGFKEGERVSDSWAKANARAYYNKKAKEIKKMFADKNLTQNQLDAMVSATGGTKRSADNFLNHLKLHWGDWAEITNWWKNFALTSANKKIQPGLVKRRKFESNWFLGNKEG